MWNRTTQVGHDIKKNAYSNDQKSPPYLDIYTCPIVSLDVISGKGVNSLSCQWSLCPVCISWSVATLALSLVSLDHNYMEGMMMDGCLAKVNSSKTLNYITYTELRTLQTFVIKKRTVQIFVIEKSAHYKLLYWKNADTTNFCDRKKCTLQTVVLKKCWDYKLL